MTTVPRPTRALPLIRRRPDGGWERLAFGSLAAGVPTYVRYEFDEAAWAEKQRRAAKAREVGV